MTDAAIIAENLSKKFRTHRGRRDSFKERFVRGKSEAPQEFWALRDASFEVPTGEVFGIIGPNGSGKSTALKVLTGIYRPTSGRALVNGRVSALLELGAGFHPELTGRENIVLNGSILGLAKKQIASSMDEIIAFSGIEDFIDSPVKVYSSGMYVRLGFAIAVKVDPEVLVIDEVIAVGDEDFQRKCFDYVRDLRDRGATVVLVSHSLDIIRDRCDRVMWLDHGHVRMLDSAPAVVDAYVRAVNEQEASQESADPGQVTSGLRHGSGEVRITALEVLNPDGEPRDFLIQAEPGTFRLHFEVTAPVARATFGLGFFLENGTNVAGPNSGNQNVTPLQPGPGYIDFHVPSMLLAADRYRVDVAVVDGGHMYDYVQKFDTLTVRGAGGSEPGLMLMPGSWRAPQGA